MEIIEKYAEGYRLVEEAVRGVTFEELMYKPSPDSWCIKEIIIHLADSELVVVDRMKRVIAEDTPPMRTMFQDLWTQRLFYTELTHETYLLLFKLLRATMSEVLRRLDDEAFDRVGIHDELGEMTLRALVLRYTEHIEKHVGQIERIKAAFRGK
ncbi:DinB family protein [Paenibacillus sp.]|uniref:DinB family protein n=1 Tax=Paenibacillus sp. TaxID=58172 RepID=UPI002D65F91C|nr:DinB family protein [Paenibacillus sp.]HZG56124.1 DinB family protein [Paenibacillus sp.]